MFSSKRNMYDERIFICLVKKQMNRAVTFLFAYSLIMLPSYIFLFFSVDYSAKYTKVDYVNAALVQLSIIFILSFVVH